MPDLLTLPNGLDAAAFTCRAIIETPRGRRFKYDYDAESGLFEVGGVLPAGMAFPLAFGFVPATLGEDGDPIDVLVLADEDLPVGCLLTVRLLGVIEAEQTEEGEDLPQRPAGGEARLLAALRRHRRSGLHRTEPGRRTHPLLRHV